MKTFKIQMICMLALVLTMAACDTDVKHTIASVDAPVFISSTPSDNANDVKSGKVTITLEYDKNVFFATEDIGQIALSGDGTITDANVYGSSKILTINARLKKGTNYTLSIPSGVVLGPNQMPAPGVSVTFSTVELTKTLVTPNASADAQKVFNYLLSVYETKSLSSTMANVSWNTEEADRVFDLTGKYPAINTFDYVHMPFSPANWIDYSDITPVKDWWDNGGLVSLMWHFNVPRLGIWNGNQDTGNWSGNVELTNEEFVSKFQHAEVGQTILVTTSNVVGGAQGSIKNSSWGEIASGYEYFDIRGNFELEITEDILAELKSGGMIIGGHDYTVTGVYLIPYAFYKADTEFDAANALVDGTWENIIYKENLAKVAASLKQLQEAGIVVIWRPYHEGAGGWFWWGKDAESYKALWIDMFNYFRNEGLNNLIWVWTCQTGDEDWYPGNQYVDIIGCDLYNETTANCVAKYEGIDASYGTKMIVLSECGTVGLMSEQWSNWATWGWFMPWYGNADNGDPHGTDAWWEDAMNQSFVVTRDDLNIF
ncbi:MAG: Ig-like domain-containing protein [Bacteroides sp.]|nr:Ig-like domain-containing protein [Bacteroides sp.]